MTRGSKASNILLIEASGQIVMDSAEPFKQRQPKAINQAQLERVVKLGYPDVSEIFTASQSGKPLINVAVPVYDAAIERDIAHDRKRRKICRSSGRCSPDWGLQKAGYGSLELVSLTGVPMSSVFSRSPTSRWGVAIGIPRATFTGDL